MRIQIELPETKVDDLKSLMKTIGVETYKDLFNNALTLLEWSVSEVKIGRSIASVDEAANKYRELTMPAFEHAAKEAARARNIAPDNSRSATGVRMSSTAADGDRGIRSQIVDSADNSKVQEDTRNVVYRPATEADFEAFKKGTVELIETEEEAVISKQARVVEEVTVGKEISERTQRIKDTLRHTEVEVEKLPGESVKQRFYAKR